MAVDVTVGTDAAREYAGPALVVAIPSGDAPLDAAAAAVDGALDGPLTRLREAGELKGKVGDATILHTFGRLPAERLVLTGIGDPAKLTVTNLRRAAAAAARAARKAGVAGLASTVYGADQFGATTAAQSIVEGTLLGLYRFDLYRPSETSEIADFVVLPDGQAQAGVESGVARGRELAAGVALARDLVNEPPNVLTPTELARRAQALAEEHGLECEVLDAAAMREMGMNALLGVASGSDEPPAFIVLRYGAGAGMRTLGYVGKGITFDSGGISIKPAENMHRMKGDMGGAAAVLGAMRAIAELEPNVAITAMCRPPRTYARAARPPSRATWCAP